MKLLDRIAKFFHERKKSKIDRKYQKLCLDKSVEFCNHHTESRDADKLIYEIISVGFKSLKVSKHSIIGILNDGRCVYLWNENLWFSWLITGLVGDIGWDVYNRESAHFQLSAYPILVNISTIIQGIPTWRAKTLLKNYFLSIDPQFFYDKVDKEYEKINKIRNIDMIKINRDLKIKELIK